MRFSLLCKNIRQAGPVVFITKIRLKYAVQYIDYLQKKMRHKTKHIITFVKINVKSILK
jgi:hypothetical protein